MSPVHCTVALISSSFCWENLLWYNLCPFWKAALERQFSDVLVVHQVLLCWLSGTWHVLDLASKSAVARSEEQRASTTAHHLSDICRKWFVTSRCDCHPKLPLPRHFGRIITHCRTAACYSPANARVCVLNAELLLPQPSRSPHSVFKASSL